MVVVELKGFMCGLFVGEVPQLPGALLVAWQPHGHDKTLFFD